MLHLRFSGRLLQIQRDCFLCRNRRTVGTRSRCGGSTVCPPVPCFSSHHRRSTQRSCTGEACPKNCCADSAPCGFYDGGWSCDTPATWLQRREIRTQSPCRQTAFSRSSFLAPRPLTAPHPFLPTDRSNAGRFFLAAGVYHIKAALFRRKRTLHPDPQI